MIVSPSLSPISRTEGDEANEDAMETLRIDADDLSTDDIGEDVPMNEVCEPVRNPDEENTLPELAVASIDLDEDTLMEEESSVPAVPVVENLSSISTPERENTNESSTSLSLQSWENVLSPTPSEIVNLDSGN
jgi:hypothetical protein